MVSKGLGHARLCFEEGEASLADALRLVELISASREPAERQLLVERLLRWGVPVEGPDVTRSARDWQIEANDGLATEWSRGRGGGSPAFVVRCGLRQIGALSSGLIDRIVARRRQAGFSDPFDFLERVVPQVSELSPLVRSGALDALSEGLTRPQLLWLLSVSRRDGQRPLFPRKLPRCLGDYAASTKRCDERQILGLFLRERPERVRQAFATPPQP